MKNFDKKLNYKLFILKMAGLFDFDATLPFMGIQFLFLIICLDYVFYKPIGNILKKRDIYIRNNLELSKQAFEKAQDLLRQYEQIMLDARKESERIIADVKSSAEMLAVKEVDKVKQDNKILIDKNFNQLILQKETICNSQLDKYVDILSDRIYFMLIET
uniref:ATP synthase CF0 B' subunit n=1 Tax=Cyanidium sp. THAL103 TaxID=3027999 RepID=A0A9Y1I420_9RHOD|nr:ATP synthase CF0 B' subunit [Cyanidium sp. THAL103]